MIGINTAIFSPSGGSIGLGFAIPSNTARRIVDQLERYGETRWGWIGIRLQTPERGLGGRSASGNAEGALVARVDKGGPADRWRAWRRATSSCPLRAHSIKHTRQLPRVIAQTAIGEEVDAVILRGGERRTLKIRIGQLDTPRRSFRALHPSRSARSSARSALRGPAQWRTRLNPVEMRAAAPCPRRSV